MLDIQRPTSSAPMPPTQALQWKDGTAFQTVPPADDQVLKHMCKLGQFGLKPLTLLSLLSIAAYIYIMYFCTNSNKAKVNKCGRNEGGEGKNLT